MMIKSNGFEFWDVGWSKGAWELKYTGEEKHMIIPKELIDQAGEDVETVRLSSETKDLESIYIPENVKDVWMGTLYATNSLKEIRVSEESPYLKSVDGVLFTKDGKKLIKMPPVKSGRFDIPEGTEEIENSAFDKSHLESVTFPKSLKKIGSYAFSGSKIRSAVIPEGVEEIEDNVFSQASDLEEFELLGNTKIEYMHMDMASEMEGRISGEGFFHTSEAYILACLKVYPDMDSYRRKFIAAAKRGKREKILQYLMDTKPAAEEQKGTFETADLDDGTISIKKYEGNEEILNIPAEIDGKKVTAIGDSAFEKNEYLMKVTLPEGVTAVGKKAFRGCISLEEVSLPESCVSIGREAFFECKSMKKANLPKGITILESKVFCDCVSLESLTLPDGLVKIGNAALKNCDSLNELLLPDGLLSLGKESLYGCGFNHGPVPEGGWGYGLKEFYIPASVKQIDDGGSGIFACYPKAQELFGVFEPKMMLKVVRGSVAHRYASKKKIRFTFV